MIVIPKEKPIHNKLSTYYLVIDKFLEYCKREQGSGCVYFYTPATKGVVFFDTDDILNTIYVNSSGKDIEGDLAYQKLLDSISKQTFQVAVYKIDLHYIYSWIGLHQLNEVEIKNLSDTVSLEKLIKKMQSQELSGYILAQIGEDEGLLLFQSGQFVCGSYSFGDGKLESDKNNLKLLVQKSNTSGGDFHVRGTVTSADTMFDATGNNKSKIDKAPSSTIATLEELLDVFGRVVDAEEVVDSEFAILLKDKFVEKANTYPFLDPFAGEFKFSNQKIVFTGKASDEELTKGVTECVRELADELGIMHILKKEISNWSTYLGDDIKNISKKFL
jgi:TATA-box binding protein (TBP) (component of TFIID and TFIIIB)